MRATAIFLVLVLGATGLCAQELPAYVPQAVVPAAGAGYVRPDGAIRIAAGNHGMGRILEGFNALFARTHPGTVFAVERLLGSVSEWQRANAGSHQREHSFGEL